MTEHPHEHLSPIGNYLKAWYGYSGNPEIRKDAASGGIATCVLDYMLQSGAIDAALVCKSTFEDGQLAYKLFLAKNLEQLQQAQTSKYFDIPITKGIELIKQFEGKVAIVGLPSQITSIKKRCEKNQELAQKIVFTIALFCGHNSKAELIHSVLGKKQIPLDQVRDFTFRKGLWRGRSIVRFKDGSETDFPFQSFSHYQNLHFLSLTRCLNCFDHMGYHADLSTGDVWRQDQKDESIKHSVFLARSPKALDVIESMIQDDALVSREVTRKDVYLAQKRSINYHYNLSARAKLAKWFGYNIRDRVHTKVRLRDLAAAFIALLNHKISDHPRWKKLFLKLPRPILTCYLYVFKGLTHYDRKEY